MKIKTSAPISLDKTQTSTLHVISQCTVGSKEHVGTIFYISIVFHHLKRLRAQWTRTKRPFRRQRCVTWWWREGTEWLTEAAQWGHGPAQSLAQALCFRHELSFPGWRSMWELWQSLLTPPSRRTTEIRWREKHVRLLPGLVANLKPDEPVGNSGMGFNGTSSETGAQVSNFN